MPEKLIAERRAEIRRASRLYRLLWLSPLFTVPGLLILSLRWNAPMIALFCGASVRNCNSVEIAETAATLAAVLASAMFHLFLLIFALDQKSQFVRWHGRQALLLAGLRTALALAGVVVFWAYSGNLIPWIGLLLVCAWGIGTIWGQSQAAAGECSLMRWAGHGASLPLVAPDEARATALAAPTGERAEGTVEALVQIIRFNRNPKERLDALTALQRLGAVEEL